ncbi:TPA: DUF4055 domain-containing protein [Enterobacter hormaechei]
MNYKAVWKPLPGSQSLSLSCPCNEILYEGTRGPGKTAAQLARFRRLVGLGYGSFWRGVIFDTEYKNLTDIITQSKRMYRLFNDGARYLASASELRWVWPTGEELLFRFGKEEGDYWDYHGQEFPFIGFNELTKQQSSEFYEMMFSCRRSSFRPENYPLEDGSLLKPIPLETFSTTNPFGIGHTWVKKRFIEPAPRGTIIRETQKVPLLTVFGLEEGQELVIGSSSATSFSDRQRQGLEYVEHTGSSIGAGKESLAELVEQMRQAGAKLLRTENTSTKSVDQTSEEKMQEQSPLYTMATSLEDAIDNILQIMAEYIGEAEGGNVDVRTELDVESKEFNPPAAMAIQSLRQGGDLRRIDAIKALQKLNLIDADADPDVVLSELLAESASLTEPPPGEV